MVLAYGSLGSTGTSYVDIVYIDFNENRKSMYAFYELVFMSQCCLC